MIETDRTHQPYEVDDLGAEDVLVLLGDAEAQERVAVRRKLRLAGQWCVLNPGREDGYAGLADVERHPGDLPDLHFAGEGTPRVAAGAPERFAAALGISTAAGQSMLADALDLQHRLRRTWRRVERLEIQPWKARKLARLTRELPAEAADWVDAELAPRLDRIGLPTIERVVLAALAAFRPDLLAERERRGRDAWRVSLEHGRGEGWDGSSFLDAVGGTADLSDFHALVCAVADRLAELEPDSGDTVGQRRARALGIIGRGEHIELLLDEPTPAPKPMVRVPAGRVDRRLFVHVDAADLVDRGAGGAAVTGSMAGQPEATVDVERLGCATLALVRDWLAGAAVRVTPVIDLGRTDAVDGYVPPAWMRELVMLRDGQCIFPHCTVDARACDLDHVEPYDTGPPGQAPPPGQTRPENLGCLCRRHHNAKTHLGWRYERAPDGTWRWTSPDGFRYLVERGETTCLDPQPDPHAAMLAALSA